MRYLILTAVAAYGLFCAHAQAATPLEKAGLWRPWKTHPIQPDALNCASKQEFGEVEMHLRKLRGLWEQVASISSPVGYEVRAEMHGFRDHCLHLAAKEKSSYSDRRYDRSQPIQSEISFFPFNYLEERGKVVPNDETEGLYFFGNTIKSGPSLQYLDAVFLEPVRLKDRYGLEAYGFCNAPGNCSGDDDYLIIRNNVRPLWQAAPLMGIYDQLLKRARADVQSFENEAEKAKGAYAEYITPKAVALREEKRRQFAPAMARNQGKTESQVIAALEASALNAEANYRRSAEAAAPKPGSMWALVLEDIERITQLQYQLKVSQAGASAFLCGKPQGAGRQMSRYGDFGLYRPVGGPGCHPVVTVNAAYFSKNLPKTAIQLLAVQQYSRCFSRPRLGIPGGCTENLKLLEGLDWNAVKGLMDK